MEKPGFDARVRPTEISTGRWILGFAVGDVVWWVVWMLIMSSAG